MISTRIGVEIRSGYVEQGLARRKEGGEPDIDLTKRRSLRQRQKNSRKLV